MDSKKALVALISFPCSVLLFFILMISLWEYRVFVGVALLMLIFATVGVVLRGMLTEQNLRIYRFNHDIETPLSNENSPMVLRTDMREKENTSQQAYYQGYRQS